MTFERGFFVFNVLELAQLRSIIAVLFFLTFSYRYLCLVVFLLQLHTDTSDTDHLIFSKCILKISNHY